MKALRKLWFKLFPKYERLDFKVLSWEDADKIIREGGKSNDPEKHWHIAIEDTGMQFPFVAIERRKRIF